MIAPARTLEGAFTVEDLFAIPEEERRHELIEGAIYEKAAATGEHEAARRRVSALVDPFERRPGPFPGGWWFVTDVEITFDAKNTLRPDVAGWRRERMLERPRGTPIAIRPDWVCEILPTNRSNHLIKRKRVYRRHEVPHCWILDPRERMLMVLRWTPDGHLDVLTTERGEEVRAEPFEAMALKVGILFGDEEDDSAEGSG